MKLIAVQAFTVVLGCISGACSTPESVPGEHPVVGSIEPQPEQPVEVAILWTSPNDDQPDVAPYLYRVATTEDGAFAAAVSAPPAEPRWQGVSMGLLFQLPKGFDLPDGRVDASRRAELSTAVREAPTSELLVFRESAAKLANVPAWFEQFPVGVSCSLCQPAKEGQTFESLAPVACEQVVLKDRKACNWT